MSQFFKGKDNRIAIFQDWDIIGPSLKMHRNDIQEKSKPEQIRRAEEALNDAQLLHTNISSFLKQKTDLVYKIDNHKRNADKLLEELYELNSNNSRDLAQEDHILLRMRQILQKLYREMREGRLLEQTIAGYFQKANLANYNPHIHQIKYNKTSVETEKFLISKLDQLRNTTRILYRNIHFMDKLPAVFTKEQSFQYGYSTLHELISHDSLVRIHTAMIGQLKDVEEHRQELMEINRSIENQYLKYELVYDCLELMREETQEIAKEKALLEENLSKATLYVPIADDNYPSKDKLTEEENALRDTMAEGQENDKTIEDHLKIYRTNLQNFNRVSAQTSLYCYVYRRALFSQALADFEHYYSQWKRNHGSLWFLYDKRGVLQTIKQQQGIRQSFSQNDRHHLTTVYEEVRESKLPKDQRLQGYRRSLLTDFEREMQRHRIGFSQREIKQTDANMILGRQSKFFQRLKSVDIREKISFLRKNKDHIEKLIFELEQLELHSSERQKVQQTVKLYAAALAFARVMASNEAPAAQLLQLESLQQDHDKTYRELPHGMTDVLLSYVYDLKLISESQLEIQTFGGQHLEQFLAAVTTMLQEKKRLKIDEAVQINIHRLNSYWLSLHSNYYRFLTPLGEELMLEQLSIIDLKLSSCIYHAAKDVTDIPELSGKSMEIDRAFFFTYRVLLSLTELVAEERRPQKIEKFRIVNLQAVLEATFQQLDNLFPEKYVNSKASDMIKLSLLEYFLLTVYKEAEYASFIKALRLQVYMQYISELYIQNFQNQLIRSCWLQPLYKIHFRMQKVTSRLSHAHNKTLAQQVTNLVNSIKRYPLTFSTKHDVSGFISCLQVEGLLKNLSAILSRGHFGLKQAAEARVALTAIQEAFVLVESRFQKYENVLIKHKKESNTLFSDLKAALEKELSVVGQRQSLQRHFLDSRSSITLQQGLSRLLPRQH